MSEIIYVQACPTMTPMPLHVGTDICTPLNATHMICESVNGVPSFQTSLYAGIIFGIAICVIIAAFHYLTTTANDHKGE